MIKSIRFLVREVIHLVLQAKPYGLKSDQVETTVLQSVYQNKYLFSKIEILFLHI